MAFPAAGADRHVIMTAIKKICPVRVAREAGGKAHCVMLSVGSDIFTMVCSHDQFPPVLQEEHMMVTHVLS